MRIVFAASAEIALPSLLAAAAGHSIAAVLTAPDSLAGRRRQIQASPVKLLAQANGWPVLQPQRLDGAARLAIGALKPDLLVCFAYGKIFGPRFLALFPQGGINIHPSLLPKYRGPSPLQAAIAAGDSATGVTIQKLALAMDCGDILAQQTIALRGDETADSLGQTCAQLAATMLEQTLSELAANRLSPRVQDESQATYCRLLKKDDGLIDWAKPAAEIERLVRAYWPWPGAYTLWKTGPLTILNAAVFPDSFATAVPGTIVSIDKRQGILVQTGQGTLAIRRLQAPARKAMDYQSFSNGLPNLIGTILGRTA